MDNNNIIYDAKHAFKKTVNNTITKGKIALMNKLLETDNSIHMQKTYPNKYVKSFDYYYTRDGHFIKIEGDVNLRTLHINNLKAFICDNNNESIKEYKNDTLLYTKGYQLLISNAKDMYKNNMLYDKTNNNYNCMDNFYMYNNNNTFLNLPKKECNFISTNFIRVKFMPYEQDNVGI